MSETINRGVIGHKRQQEQARRSRQQDQVARTGSSAQNQDHEISMRNVSWGAFGSKDPPMETPKLQQAQNAGSPGCGLREETSRLTLQQQGPDSPGREPSHTAKRKESEPPETGSAKPDPKRGRGQAPKKTTYRDRDFDRGDEPRTRRLFNPAMHDPKTFNIAQPIAQEQPRSQPEPDRPARDPEKLEKHFSKPTKAPLPIVSQQPPSLQQHQESLGPCSDSQDASEDKDQLQLIKQPETKNISPEQLIAEVKGIYAGLIMVEAKCIEVDKKQHHAALEIDCGRMARLNNEQWQALIALHRTLLHEHHDFFLASQHPSASTALKRLADKYDMPARMWRHGIHSFLELLRHRLPESREQMLTFIYLSYTMMALLYETVPAFKDTWIECLGDLGRYRMAIEDDDLRDRDVWQEVSRNWYSTAADKSPEVGRLYHHLAILARPDVLSQLFYYCKSLTVSAPFSAARESILTVFDPTPDVKSTATPPVMADFVRLHSIIFTHVDLEHFDDALESMLTLLDKHLGLPSTKWRDHGCMTAVCNITALFQYGARESLLRRAYKSGRKQSEQFPADDGEKAPKQEATHAPGNDNDPAADLLPPYTDAGKDTAIPGAHTDLQIEEVTHSIQEISLSYSKRLSLDFLRLTLDRYDDPNVATHWHTWLAFILHLTKSNPAMRLIESDFPWEPLVFMLNFQREGYTGAGVIDNLKFPRSADSTARPLPEDYTLRGLEWTRKLYPDGWFDKKVDPEEKGLELPSMAHIRTERILWLGMRIAVTGSWLAYDTVAQRFSVHEALKKRIEDSQRKVAAAAKKREMAMMSIGPEDDDIEMGSAVCSNSEDEDYVMVAPDAVRLLAEKKRQLEAQLQAAVGTVVSGPNPDVSKPSVVKGADALKLGYTGFIVDTNLLISHLGTFELIASKGWAVIIPNSVITELNGLGNNTGPVGDCAKSATIAINKAINERKDVRIITAKGNDVTKIGFFREKLELEDSSEDEAKNIDDIIIRTTRQQRFIRSKVREDVGPAEPAILLTEDTNMRVKANARGVPAISTTVLKKYLLKLGPGGTAAPQPRSSPSAKRKSQSNLGPRVKIEGEDDDIEFESQDPPKLPQRRRGAKRGKVGTEIASYGQVR